MGPLEIGGGRRALRPCVRRSVGLSRDKGGCTRDRWPGHAARTCCPCRRGDGRAQRPKPRGQTAAILRWWARCIAPRTLQRGRARALRFVALSEPCRSGWTTRMPPPPPRTHPSNTPPPPPHPRPQGCIRTADNRRGSGATPRWTPTPGPRFRGGKE